MRRNPRNVALLAYNDLCLFEFGAMMELFGLARPELEEWYRLKVVGLEPGPLHATGGVSVEAPYSLRSLDHAGTIIIPGWRSLHQPAPEVLLRKLRRAHEQGARLISACSGAFVLAATGLLDGKTAATHWKYAKIMQENFPEVHVNADVLFVDEGQILTSAGSAACLDMGLHLIRRDFGAHIANNVARRLVIPPQRDGGQKQYVSTPVQKDSVDGAFAQLLEEVRSRLRNTQSIQSMAKRAKMSERTFARRFKQVTGTTPHRWLQQERVRLAQSLLETTALNLDQIARRTGFSDAQLLRLHFKRVVGTTPMHYQRSFQAAKTTA